MIKTLLSGCLGFVVGCLIGITIVTFGNYPASKQEHTYIVDEVVSAPRIIEVQYIENEVETDRLKMISQRMQEIFY